MRRWPIVVLFALTAVTSWAAQMRAGAAKISIRPQFPVRVTGGSDPDRPAEFGSGDIFARALAIDDGSGNRAVILSVELRTVPRALAERVAAGIMKAHGLERGQIVISATGTHNAPFVQGLFPVLSPAGADERRNVADYTAVVSRTLFDVATAALANLQPDRLSFSFGSATFAVNAPLYGAVEGSGSKGPLDAAVPVLRIATLKGDTLAVVFSHARREATLGSSAQSLSGDYAGLAAATLERDSPGSVTLFLQSCDGPQAPLPRRSVELATSLGTALAAEVARVLSRPMQPVTGRLRTTLIETSLPFAPHTREQFEAELKSSDPALVRRAKLVLEAYDARREPRQLPYPVQVVRFARGFALVALAGEPAASYTPKIRNLLGRPDLMIVAGANDGGYSVPAAGNMDSSNAAWADSIVDSGFPGAFTDEVEERILTTVERAWKRVAK